MIKDLSFCLVFQHSQEKQSAEQNDAKTTSVSLKWFAAQYI